MESIDQLCRKLEDAIYEEGIDPKITLIKAISTHRDREIVFEKERVMTAILRTLTEVGYWVNSGPQKESGFDQSDTLVH